jgi:flagellar biosynthesis chaperone FliJ
VAHSLQELVTCVGLEANYNQHADAVSKLQDTVQTNLQRLLAFRQSWNKYEDLCEKVEAWARESEGYLKSLSNQKLTTANMRQFWVKYINFVCVNY